MSGVALGAQEERLQPALAPSGWKRKPESGARSGREGDVNLPTWRPLAAATRRGLPPNLPRQSLLSWPRALFQQHLRGRGIG